MSNKVIIDGYELTKLQLESLLNTCVNCINETYNVAVRYNETKDAKILNNYFADYVIRPNEESNELKLYSRGNIKPNICIPIDDSDSHFYFESNGEGVGGNSSYEFNNENMNIYIKTNNPKVIDYFNRYKTDNSRLERIEIRDSKGVFTTTGTYKVDKADGEKPTYIDLQIID